MSKLAFQAISCYNPSRNIVVSEDTANTLRLVANLYRRSTTMNTLPPHADNGNFQIALPNTPGIYKIICTVTGKIYIGSTTNLRKRRNYHLSRLNRNIHHNSKLQRAWNKYGEQSFAFEILELVIIRELLTAREQYWLNKLKPFGKRGFNMAPMAGSPLGVKHTPETREKVRQANLGREVSPETREKIRQAQIGKRNYERTPEILAKMKKSRWGDDYVIGSRHHTPEAIEHMRQAQRGKKKPTPEAREKMSQASLGRKKSPETLEKLRQAKLGQKHTPETIEKIRQVAKARPVEALEHMRQAKRNKRKGAS